MKNNYYLLQTDENYAIHSFVTAMSVQEHTPDNCHNVFFVINDHIKQETCDFMVKRGADFGMEFRFVDMFDIIAKFEELKVPKWRGKYTTYFKLFALNRIEGVERILYLDSDLIVTKDISDVFSELNGTDMPLAMAEDMTISTRLDYKKYILETDNEASVYYNAGVALFDIKRWKEQNCEDKIYEFIADNTKKLMFCEQDILNVVFKNQVKTISNIYNYCTPLTFFGIKTMSKLFYWNDEQQKNYTELMDTYCIGHCFGVLSRRPWHKKSKHPLTNEYIRIYQKLYEKPFVGVEISLGIKEKLQSALYYTCRPVYCLMHKFFTNKLYSDFINQNKSV